MENFSEPSTNRDKDATPLKIKVGASPRGDEKLEHKEGPTAKAIEKQTAKLPSDLFLWMAGATVLGSAGLKVMEYLKTPAKHRKVSLSLFVGMWAPTILMLGVYNKIVKVAGSDRSAQTS